MLKFILAKRLIRDNAITEHDRDVQFYTDRVMWMTDEEFRIANNPLRQIISCYLRKQ